MARRVNPNRVKINRSYATAELASLFEVHKNTIRNWRREGLSPIDGGRPTLFHGRTVKDFLVRRNASRKRPCPPGKFYCFRCREPREPALGLVEYVELAPGTGNLRAICGACETLMYRRARKVSVPSVMPNLAVQMAQAGQRLVGSSDPSLNCDDGGDSTP